MLLNVNKFEIKAILDALDQRYDDLPPFGNLKEKLRRLQTSSETVKSTIEQVRTAEEQ